MTSNPECCLISKTLIIHELNLLRVKNERKYLLSGPYLQGLLGPSRTLSSLLDFKDLSGLWDIPGLLEPFRTFFRTLRTFLDFQDLPGLQTPSWILGPSSTFRTFFDFQDLSRLLGSFRTFRTKQDFKDLFCVIFSNCMVEQYNV